MPTISITPPSDSAEMVIDRARTAFGVKDKAPRWSHELVRFLEASQPRLALRWVIACFRAWIAEGHAIADDLTKALADLDRATCHDAAVAKERSGAVWYGDVWSPPRGALSHLWAAEMSALEGNVRRYCTSVEMGMNNLCEAEGFSAAGFDAAMARALEMWAQRNRREAPANQNS